MSWHTEALCREVGIELFFPHEETGFDYTAARTVCAQCTVRAECAAEAMDREGTADRHNRHGMWGGLSPKQRHLLHVAQRQEATA